ncbi:MAG: protein kinase [Myxococcaceae bacterium]
MDAPETLDPTLPPSETVRVDRSGSQGARGLPALSIDLRVLSIAAAGEATPGADLELRGVIGEGGMGRVLLARQHSLTRDVAVKTSREHGDEQARAAILLEGVITGSLEHPGIVPVHALGLDTNGLPAMVMKRVEGVAWDVLVADPAHAGWEGWEGTKEDRLPGHLQLLLQVCNALHYAHSRGVVHRDLKPQNVLIGKFGDVYLADWGVAARVGEVQHSLCGTPAHLAPEMVVGGVIDERTDVYLLGSTLHLLLTGAPRHPGATITEALLHAKTSAPFTYGPTVPAELGALANDACAADPAKRPPSARAFRDRLSSYLKHRDAAALAAQATRRFAELEALLQQPKADDAQKARVERLLSEAHFGLEQSLTQWPENDAARAVLTRVEALQADRRRRLEELEAQARELDPRSGSGWRTVGMAVMTMMAAVAATISLFFAFEPSKEVLVAFPAVIGGVMALGAVAFRRQLLNTRFNRQAFTLVATSLAFIFLGRVLGLVVPINAATHVVRDCFVIATVSTIGAVSYFRWVWVVAVMFCAAAAWCSLQPQFAIPIFAWVDALTLAVATWFSWRDAKVGVPIA